MTSTYHIPVMLAECLEGLAIKLDGIYTDCTYGGGGHSRGILDRLGPNGRLLAFDQDADALANKADDSRLIFIPENFRYLRRYLRLHGVPQIHGLLADLGVSSHQFDTGERGFSTRYDGPLDMRMDLRNTRTAAQLIMDAAETELHKIFEQYGEVTNSRTLARHIATHRRPGALLTTGQFRSFLAPLVKGNPARYFAQVFQALRIAVNEELQVLRELLEQCHHVVAPGGRIVIITFHSLEDRMVKNYLRGESGAEGDPHDLFGRQRSDQQYWKLLGKKPLEASPGELKINPRSRSARVRIAERTEVPVL